MLELRMHAVSVERCGRTCFALSCNVYCVQAVLLASLAVLVLSWQAANLHASVGAWHMRPPWPWRAYFAQAASSSQ